MRRLIFSRGLLQYSCGPAPKLMQVQPREYWPGCRVRFLCQASDRYRVRIWYRGGTLTLKQSHYV